MIIPFCVLCASIAVVGVTALALGEDGTVLGAVIGAIGSAFGGYVLGTKKKGDNTNGKEAE